MTDASSRVASALAYAFLAGEWRPAAMSRRGGQILGERKKWVAELAEVVRSGYPDPPLDRPRELAAFIMVCEPFWRAHREGDAPRDLRRWIVKPVETVTPRWNVPRLDDHHALARWLGLTVHEFHWFADPRSFERRSADQRLRHYRRTWVRKPDGSVRLLEAPKRHLKVIQREILHDVLDRIPPHHAAHGFTPNHSALTGASLHQGRDVVVTLDLEAFFASITVGRVYGVFRAAGYPEPVAHFLAGLCTTSIPVDALRDAPRCEGALREKGQRLLDQLRRPHLPQGSPTSPALANLVAFRLDRRLTGLADKLGAAYTRYADDLAFSGDRALVRNASTILRLVEEIARDEGFRVHDGKTRVRTAAQRQLVTGRVVNHTVNVPRDDYDRLRAVLHDAAVHGPAHANRTNHPDFHAHLLGRIAWAGAANDRRRAKLERAFAAITW